MRNTPGLDTSAASESHPIRKTSAVDSTWQTTLKNLCRAASEGDTRSAMNPAQNQFSVNRGASNQFPSSYSGIRMSLSSLGFLILVALSAWPARAHAQAGAVDSSFNPALNSGAAVYTVTRLTNGQILIGGAFNSIGVVNIANVARLNLDGTLDTTFKPGTTVNIGYVSAMAVQPDGKVLVGGAFFSSSGTAPGNLARLNPDGTVDKSFDPDLYVDANVNALAV